MPLGTAMWRKMILMAMGGGDVRLYMVLAVKFFAFQLCSNHPQTSEPGNNSPAFYIDFIESIRSNASQWWLYSFKKFVFEVRFEWTTFIEHTRFFQSGQLLIISGGKISHISGQFSNICLNWGDVGERFDQYWWTPNGASEYIISDENIASSSNVAGLRFSGNLS